MFDFLRRNRVLVTTALLLVLAGGLVVAARGEHLRDDRLGRLLLEAMAPLQRAGAFAIRSLEDTWRGVEGLFRAREEAVALKARVRELEQATRRLAEVELENRRLRRALDFREALGGEPLTARVIGHDATGRSRTLTIDRGTQGGVGKGAAVLASEGIVGHVFLASPHAARVLLITDRNSGADALVQRTRARGIVAGTVGGCAFEFVRRTEDVRVGDRIVTSGLDGIFPKGLPVGTVASVAPRGQGLFLDATIEPAVDFDRLEEVLVTRHPVEPARPGAPPAS